MQLASGVYAAHPGAATVEEAKSGALMLYIMMDIKDGPSLRSSHCIVNKEGVVMTKNIERLREWAVGWDGADPYWFMENDISALDVEVVIEQEAGYNDPSKMFPVVKWVNAPGGGGGGALPEATDKKLVMAKYGAKFRAIAGGVTVAPPRKTPAPPVAQTPPPTRPAPSAPPPARKVAAAHTQATAWEKMCAAAASEGLENDARDKHWFKFVDATGMDQADMTPEGWAQVEQAIEESQKQGTLLPF